VASKWQEFVDGFVFNVTWPSKPPAVCDTPTAERDAFRASVREGAYRQAFAQFEMLEEGKRPLLKTLTVDYTPPPRMSWRARLGRWLERIAQELQRE
jgi:hypothetical protein